MANEPLMTYEEAADYLNTTVRHVRKMRDCGGIPSLKVGRLVRFRREDIDKWLEAGGR